MSDTHEQEHEMLRQHRELIDLFTRLDEAVKRGEERKAIYRLISEIISYTELHFEAEERIMVECGYPEIDEHKAKHKQLLHDAHKFRKQLDLYGEGRFSDWFNHWPFPAILAHIQNADHQIGDHITHKQP